MISFLDSLAWNSLDFYEHNLIDHAITKSVRTYVIILRCVRCA